MMKNKMFNKWIAIILSLCFVFVGVLTAAPTRGEASTPDKQVNYTEYSFASLGVYGTVEKTLFPTNLDTWDGIALSGEVTFKSSEGASALMIGNEGTSKWHGIQLYPVKEGLRISCIMGGSDSKSYYMKTDGNSEVIITNQEAGVERFLGNTVSLRLTFDYVDEGIKVGLFVEDAYVRTVLITTATKQPTMNVKDYIGSHILGYGVTIERLYNEVNLTDFGVCGTVESTYFPTNLETWDGIALSGKVRTKSSAGASAIMIGNDGTKEWRGIQLYPVKEGLQVACVLRGSDSKNHYMQTDGGYQSIITNDEAGVKSFLGSTVRMRLTFDYVDAGIQMRLFVEGKYVRTVLITNSFRNPDMNAKDYIGSYILGYGVELDSTYSEVNLTDFGISGTVENTLFSTKLDSWDAVALSGNVTFQSTQGASALMIGNDGTKEWHGIQLYPVKEGLQIACILRGSDLKNHYMQVDGNYETIIKNAEAGVKSFLGNTVDLRVTFNYVDAGIQMGLFVNGKYARTVLITSSFKQSDMNAKDYIGTRILGYGLEVSNPYQELTFDSLGLEGKETQMQDTKLEQWDKVAVTGELTWGKKQGQSALCIGHLSTKDWYGIQFSARDTGLNVSCILPDGEGTVHYMRVNGTSEVLISPTAVGLQTFLGTKVKMRVTFDYIEQGIKMRVIVNDRLVETIEITNSTKDNNKNVKDYVGSYIYATRVEFAKHMEPIIQQTPEELGFKMITINSFVLPHNATYAPGMYKQNSKMATYVGPSLDMTCLDVDVTFEKTEGARFISYASGDGWRGIMIALWNGTELLFRNAEFRDGDSVSFTAEELGLKSFAERFNLKLGLDMGEFSEGINNKGKPELQCDEIKICIWINNTLVAKDVVLKNVVMAGNQIGIHVSDSGITLETPKNAKQGVDFSLFGYSKEWKRELGL